MKFKTGYIIPYFILQFSFHKTFVGLIIYASRYIMLQFNKLTKIDFNWKYSLLP